MLVTRLRLFLILLPSSLGLIGCHHQIAFEDIAYTIESPKQETAILVVSIKTPSTSSFPFDPL